MKQTLLILSLMLLTVPSRAQQRTPVGTANGYVQLQGATLSDTVLAVPIRDTINWNYTTFRKLGRLTIRPQDKRMYYHDSTKWTSILTVNDTTFINQIVSSSDQFILYSDTGSIIATRAFLTANHFTKAESDARYVFPSDLDTTNTFSTIYRDDTGKSAMSLHRVAINGPTTDRNVTFQNRVYVGDSTTRTYTFVGTSITAGSALTATQRFPYIVSQSFGATQNNQGVSASTLIYCVSCSSLSSNLSRIPTYTPGDKLIIEYGTNDIRYAPPTFTPARYALTLDSVLDNAASKGWAMSEVLLTTTAKFYGTFDGWTIPYANGQLRQDSFNNVTRNIAATRGTMFCDMWALTEPYGMSLLMADSLHPSATGHVFMAAKIDSVLSITTPHAGDTNLTLYGKAKITNDVIVGGDILIGTSRYDKVNNRLGIGQTSPAEELSLSGTLEITAKSPSDNVAVNLKNSIGLNYFRVVEASTAGGGGSIIYGVRTVIGGNGNTLWSFNVSGGATSNALWASGGSIATPTDLPSGLKILTVAKRTLGNFVDYLTLDFEGRLGIGPALIPTAVMHLRAGTAAAGTAPFKFTSGTNLSVPENGTVEYDGTNYYATSGGVRYTLSKTLTNTATLDFGNTAAGASTDLTITITGAALGDNVSLGVPNGSTVANGSFSAWVSASNTVKVRFTNNDLTTAYDPASGTFRASIIKY